MIDNQTLYIHILNFLESTSYFMGLICGCIIVLIFVIGIGKNL